MEKISAYTATADAHGEFWPGNPAQSLPATTIRYPWMNMLQRELVAVVEGAGLALDVNDDGQVLKAIQALAERGALHHVGNANTVFQSLVANTWTAVNLDTPEYDSDNIVSGNALVVPEGVSRVELHGSVRIRPTGGAGFWRASITETGGVDPGAGQAISEAYGDTSTHMAIPVRSGTIDVTPGQSFKLWVKGTQTADLERYYGTWLMMLIIK